MGKKTVRKEGGKNPIVFRAVKCVSAFFQLAENSCVEFTMYVGFSIIAFLLFYITFNCFTLNHDLQHPLD